MDNKQTQNNTDPSNAPDAKPGSIADEVAKALSSLTTPEGSAILPNEDVKALEEDGAEGLHEHVLEIDAELGKKEVTPPPVVPTPVPVPTPPPPPKKIEAPSPPTPKPVLDEAPHSVVMPLSKSAPSPLVAPILRSPATDAAAHGLTFQAESAKIPDEKEVAQPISKNPAELLTPIPQTPKIHQPHVVSAPLQPKPQIPKSDDDVALDVTEVMKQSPASAQKRISILEQLKGLAASPLHPLRTYQSDAEESVKDRGTSLVSILAAEEDRRTRQTAQEVRSMPRPTSKQKLSARNMFFVVAALLLLTASIVAVFYIFFVPTKEIPIQGLSGERLVQTEEAVPLPIDGLGHDQIMRDLTVLRTNTQLSLGLMREIYFVKNDAAGTAQLQASKDVVPLLAPHMPQELVRALDPSFIVGVHVYDDTQGFIVLKTDGFEQTASALFAWEPTMRADLLPFMDRRMRPKLQSEIQATTSVPRVVKSDFVDAVVENRDARVLYDNFGDIALLYSFLDRNTVVITTNNKTLLEVITRYRTTK